MAEACYTTEAYRDLDEIVIYIARYNPLAATQLMDRIEHTCEAIAENPGVGQAREDLRPGVRFFPVGNYLIFYQAVVEGAQILRVLHGARDYGAQDF